MSSDDSIKVAVRVRPFNAREKALNSKCIISMSGQTTTIEDPETGKPSVFTFDYSYWSHDESDPHYATQEMVYNDLGKLVLENAWKGYNASLFAYGQTGSGKSYSMVGYGSPGIIPRACDEIFKRIEQEASDSVQFKVVASMVEIYNEEIRDLFNPKNNPAHGLKLREHPVTGPYVEELSEIAVRTYDEISQLMDKGSKARTVAATNMNDNSSRAHTLFQIILTKTEIDKERGKATDKVSKISLVDLAGSERAKDTGAKGDRLMEGCAINKSLSSLGNVIAALVKKSQAKGKKKDQVFIPYRDSKLTLIMKESLGGNARTIMISALSPASVNYEETLSTLKYANRAKQIKNAAVVNEDPNERIIKQLREEIENLRKQLSGTPITTQNVEIDEEARREMERLREELEASQRLIQNLQMSEEEKRNKDAQIAEDRDQVLRNAGLLVDHNQNLSYICNLHPDKQMSETLIFYLKEGSTLIGRKGIGDGKQPDIPLGGVKIQPEHCEFIVEPSGEVVLKASSPHAATFVNGKRVDTPVTLNHNDRLIFGSNHTYLFKKSDSLRNDDDDEDESANSEIDYYFAQREFAEEQGITGMMKTSTTNEELEKKMREMQEQIQREKEEKEKAIEEQNRKMKEEQRRLKMEQKRMMEELKRKEREIRENASQLQTTQMEKLKQQQNEELERIKASLEQQQKEAEEKVKQQQLEIERKRKELEEETQRQLELAESLKRKRVRDERNRSEIEEKLISAIPMVNEANAIAIELGKNVQLEVKLISNLQSTDNTTETVTTDVGVLVHNMDSNRSYIWHYEKFQNRFYLIQDLYQHFLREIEEHPNKPFVVDEKDDPYWDPIEEQEVSVGISILNLKCLSHQLNMSLWIPIFNTKGEKVGEIKAGLTPLSDKGHPIIDDYVDPDELLGQQLRFELSLESARGLPRDKCTDVYLRFKVPSNVFDTGGNDGDVDNDDDDDDEERKQQPEWTCTSMVHKRTIAPEFHFTRIYNISRVTSDHIKYLRSSALKFETMAKQSQDSAVRPSSGNHWKRGLPGGGGVGGGGPMSRPTSAYPSSGQHTPSSDGTSVYSSLDPEELHRRNVELQQQMQEREAQKQRELDSAVQRMKEMEEEMKRLKQKLSTSK